MKSWRIGIFALIWMLLLTGCGGGEKVPAAVTFSYENVQIAPGVAAAPVIEALGRPTSYGESPTAHGASMEKTYGYGSFYFTTCLEEGQERIYRIWFADDTVETAAGIRIGSTLDQVKQAYPDAMGSEEPDRQVYSLSEGEGILSVILEEGSVANILYRSAGTGT